jgi:hypothetical protein
MGNENYNDEMVERVHQALKQLPDSPPGKRTAKDAVRVMRVELKRKRAGGWSFEELAAFLREQGIKVQARSLQNYLSASGRAKPDSEGKTSRKQGPEKGKTVETVSVPPSPGMSSVEDTPEGGSVSSRAPVQLQTSRMSRSQRRTAFFNEDN